MDEQTKSEIWHLTAGAMFIAVSLVSSLPYLIVSAIERARAPVEI